VSKTKRVGSKSGDAAALMTRLIEAARAVRLQAYAPYSKYRVGAAIATRSGAVFVGCNVENASYGACLCAERNAIAQMVVAGEKQPVACAVVTQVARPGSPCGICRQVLAEFALDMPIALVGDGATRNKRRDTTLAALLPDAFRFKAPPR